MPNNGSLPNMQMANWIRNFVTNHPQRSIPEPNYKLDNEYESQSIAILQKSAKSNENTLVLEGYINIIQNYTKNIEVFYVDNYDNKINITDFTFNFNDDYIEINLDSSYYDLKYIKIIVIVYQEYSGVKLIEINTCYYNKYYRTIDLNEEITNFLDKIKKLK